MLFETIGASATGTRRWRDGFASAMAAQSALLGIICDMQKMQHN
jgi:hypothetical protein